VPLPSPLTQPALSPWQWDVFCRVIDNWGDAGVCLRLCRDLVSRGHRIRLWVDDLAPLGFMCGDAPWPPGLTVHRWLTPQPLAYAKALFAHAPPQVWVEAFGCEVATEFIAAWADLRGATGQLSSQDWPTWINLEYLSAEAVVQRMHKLPSPIASGPAAGVHKRFFYPGFVAGTGGLLREPDLAEQQAQFDRAAWRHAHGLPTSSSSGVPLVASLFCYEPPALPHWLHALQQGSQATHLGVTAGRAAQAVAAALPSPASPACADGPVRQIGALHLHALPLLRQPEYDRLLWACDLNLVRGEDSLVRALWAGQPFIWQIYPQHDNAHHAKLAAFLDWLEAPASLRYAHAVWNGLEPGALPCLTDQAGHALRMQWRDCVQAARHKLLAQADLVSQLVSAMAHWREPHA
jgi:uncharacterized repeat protein (TIGR03837 family)